MASLREGSESQDNNSGVEAFGVSSYVCTQSFVLEQPRSGFKKLAGGQSGELPANQTPPPEIGLPLPLSAPRPVIGGFAADDRAGGIQSFSA